VDRLTLPVGPLRFDAVADGPEDGELVLLLHGFPQTSWCWRHQLPALAAAGYRAVAPDQRGYSPGARPEGVDAYRMDHLVADVLGMADEIGGHRFHLVGHDWGAAVAWRVAGRYPDRLRSLSVLSVPHPRAFRRAIDGELGGDQADRSSYMAFFRSPDAEDSFLGGDGDGLRRLFELTALPGLPASADPYLAALGTRPALTGALNWYRAVELTDADDMGPVTAPTLYVWSDQDPALGREPAEATAAEVDGPYRFEVLEGVGHWIPEQAPDRLNEVLLDHLAGADRL
jgi:pimeloyl-ACP methyl ester carboxylesterase